jgi:hypothetical protein
MLIQAAEARVRAWGRALVITAWLTAAVSNAAADTRLTFTPEGEVGLDGGATPQPPRVVVDAYDGTGLEVTVDLMSLELTHQTTPGGEFVLVGWPKPSMGGELGEPALPVIRRLFAVPEGSTVDVEVREGDVSIVDLQAVGFAAPLMPVQAPVTMAPGAQKRAPFLYQEAAYSLDTLLPAERVVVAELGIVRHQHIYMMEVRPTAYNPVQGTLMIWPHIEVDLTFQGDCPESNDLGTLPALSGVLMNPQPSRLIGRGSGNYLIVTTDPYAATLPMTQFIAAKGAQGFNVDTYSVPAGTSAAAIKAYIQVLWDTPEAPDYILLVGDTSIIPTWTGGGNSSADTDLPYACMDVGDDWYPDIAIGRFSVQSEDDLQAVVDKTLYVENGNFDDPDYVWRVSMLAGNDSSCGDHEAHNHVIETYLEPDGYDCERLFYRETGADTAEVTAAINDGRFWCVYFGHSGSDHWFKPTYYQSNVQALSNENLYGIVISFSCNTTRITVGECFGETWQIEADKGAVGFWGASTYIYWTNPPWVETAALYDHVFYSIYVDGIDEFGPAYHAGLYRLLNQYGAGNLVSRDYFEMFLWLGDPSLPVLMLPSFRVGADPSSQDICAPEDAVYTVNVEPIADFSEPVTMTVNGEPLGTTVDFSVNSVPPPFSTVLTIGNTGSALPGEYGIEIIGTGSEIQRSTVVGLGVSNDIPGAVSLTSPPNGALDISRLPTLSWTPGSQAMDYDLEVATDPGFTDVVYSVTVGDTSHTLELLLEALTEYHWHVRAVNGCGNGDFSPAFSFTTVWQADYFTERFPESVGGFDLDAFSVTFIPDGSASSYRMCGSAITELPTDPAGGTPLVLSDDGSATSSSGTPVWLYGTAYDTIYINANGNITFDSADGTYSESIEAHFAHARVSALFDDLNPSTGGVVSRKQTADRVAVTWQGVPEYGSSNSNTFQIELLFNGEIHISWLGVASSDSVVGLSEGNGIPPDFVEMDLSATGACFSYGDFDGDGDVDLDDYNQFGSCFTGSYGGPLEPGCEPGDFDGDHDIDCDDWGQFVLVWTGPPDDPPFFVECEVVAPLPEDSIGIACTDDGVCPNISSCIAGVCYVPKNRYVSLRPSSLNAGAMTARRISLATTRAESILLGWVGPPDANGICRLQAAPEYRDWSLDAEVIHVTECEIAPGWSYLIQAIVEGQSTGDESNYSGALPLPTAPVWGDVVSTCPQNVCDPPQGDPFTQPNIDDVLALVNAFQGVENAPLTWLDIDPATGDGYPEGMVAIGDVLLVVNAFQGQVYPGNGPLNCQ